MGKNSRTRLTKVIKKPSWTNAMKSLPGWMPTRLLKKMNTKTSKRRSRGFATLSSPSCTKLLVVLQEVCLEACPEVCQVQAEPLEPDLDLLLKKSIKLVRRQYKTNLLIMSYVNKHYYDAFKI